MSKTDWAAIKADYLATGRPYNELASKWKVSISTLKKRAAREKWAVDATNAAIQAETEVEPQKMEPVPSEEAGKEPEPEAVPFAEIVDPMQLAIEMRAERRRKLLLTTDSMMDRIITALDIIEPANTYAISMLVRALKDLRDLQGLSKDQLDLEEQQARIAKLRSETRDQESQSAGGVLLIPAIDEDLTPPEEDKQ